MNNYNISSGPIRAGSISTNLGLVFPKKTKVVTIETYQAKQFHDLNTSSVYLESYSRNLAVWMNKILTKKNNGLYLDTDLDVSAWEFSFMIVEKFFFNPNEINKLYVDNLHELGHLFFGDASFAPNANPKKRPAPP